MSNQPESFIWYVHLSAAAADPKWAMPLNLQQQLQTPVELLNNQTRWKWFRFRRWFFYSGGNALGNIIASLSMPSRPSRIDIINPLPLTVYYPDFTYCTAFVQNNVTGASPWFRIDSDYIPQQLTLTLNSLPGFGTQSQAGWGLMEMEFLDDNYLVPPSI